MQTLGELIVEVAAVFQPPERLTVTEAAQKYVTLKNPPRYEGPYLPELTPYMVEPQNMTQSPDHTALIFCGPAQTGKALPTTTPIATPQGWTTMGELQVGDEVYGDDGRPTKVVFATDTMVGHECFDVHFDDGTSLVADADHVWTVDRAKAECGYAGPARANLTTKEIAASVTFGGGRRAYAIPNPKPLEAPEADLPLDPYTLGAWLGDGHRLGNRIYGALPDLVLIDERVRAAGYPTSVSQDGKGLGVLRVFPEQMHKGLSEFVRRLRAAGIEGYAKRIPPAYLRASEEQRWDLLRGLMDTDGSADKRGGCEFSNTNQQLVEDFCELLRTLGFKPLVVSRHTYCGHKGERRKGALSWRVTFRAYSDALVFRLARKQCRLRPRSEGRPGHTERRWITSVTPTKSVPVRCIQVDNASHLYLAGKQMVPTHNTEALVLNTWAYHVKCNPMDMLLYGPSQTAARDFSMRRIDRMHRNSPAIGSEVPSRSDDNTHDKTYRSGIIGSILWPSPNELSSKPAPVVMFTEYDRMPDDVGGEGSPFILGRKRTTTFRNMAMTLVDSSPSREVTDPRKKLVGHEAPPCTGVLGLYNEGDRRRWYWPCPNEDCGEFFETSFGDLQYQTDADDFGEDGEPRRLTYAEIAATVHVRCPFCQVKILPEQRNAMNAKGVWLRDGEKIRPDGSRYGRPLESDTASYWLKGPAAAFVTWPELVVKYVKAWRKFEQTNDDTDLRTTVNTDQGEPYIPRAASTSRMPEDIMASARTVEAKAVPQDARALMACVDVQKNMFVVQVMALIPGKPFEAEVVDRFDIVKSKRTDEDGDALWVKPATELDDWDLIEEQVIDREYPIAGGIGSMAVSLTLCDSGGKEGVTTNAYNYWRRLNAKGKGARLQLVKGEPKLDAPRVRLGYPDSQNKNRHAGAMGEIPILFINVNVIKDYVDAMLSDQRGKDGEVVGPPKVRFPDWLELWFYEELTAETRDTKRRWTKTRSRNEAFDLLTYFVAAAIARGVESVNWDNPPTWVKPLGENPMVTLLGQSSVDKRNPSTPSLARLGSLLA